MQTYPFSHLPRRTRLKAFTECIAYAVLPQLYDPKQYRENQYFASGL